MSGIHDCPDCDCEPSPREPLGTARIRDRHGFTSDTPINHAVLTLCDALDKTRTDADAAVRAAAREINELRSENAKLLRKLARGEKVKP